MALIIMSFLFFVGKLLLIRSWDSVVAVAP